MTQPQTQPGMSAVATALGFDVGAKATGTAVGNGVSGTARAPSVGASAAEAPARDERAHPGRDWSP